MSEDLMSKNSKAMSLIILSCEDHIIRLFGSDDLAASAWRSLEKQYGHVGFSARHLAFQSLVSTNLTSCGNVDTYIDQFRTHITTLSQMSTAPLPQWLLLSILINNVGSTFEAWSQSIMQQVRVKTISENSHLYLDEVIASLIDEARRMNHGGPVHNQNTAMTARKGGKVKPICKYCGKIHKSDNCWLEFPEKRPTARYSSTSQNQQAQQNHQSQQPDNIAFLSKNKSGRCDIWIIDSGATQHMCNDQSQFIDFESFSTTITIANNSVMHATGRGNVELHTALGNSFTLQNVLFVPQLASNLISVCCAMKNPKVRLNFVNSECHILYQDKIIATAKQRDSLLVLETVSHYAYASKATDIFSWHKRLGHLNEEYMKKGSFQLKFNPNEKFSCETCLKNKSTRVISRNQVAKAKRPLEKIHTDLVGPITPLSLGGNKYVLTFTDDYSRFSWVFPCSEKSQCFDIFKVFKKGVENELNQKIAFLHCDNGGEYTSNEWKRFVQDEGIQMIYTVPHTPEQNGVAERLNRTLFNMTRCFLHDSPNLVKSLWAELIRTACYIKNRIPSSTNENFKSSYEVLFGRQPSIDHLRIIGSICYSNNTGKITGKLDERATECILVGYESNNIFRVYDPATLKVFRSRDVVIKESLPKTYLKDSSTLPRTEETNIRDAEHDNIQVDLTNQGQNELRCTRIPRTITPEQELDQTPQRQYFTAKTSFQPDFDSSIDELADPRYDTETNIPRAFVSKCLVATDAANQYIPETLEQAMRCEHSRQWAESMRDEIKSIYENKTWKLVPMPKNGARVIQGRWVYRTKTDANGKLVKHKARWVVRGFQQEEGCNYTDTFASVVKPMTYKILFSIAASRDFDIEQMDVKTAFLNSPIHDDVYVEQPHGFEVTTKGEQLRLEKDLFGSKNEELNQTFTFPRKSGVNVNIVCKLDKALYGLKQAPRAWYDTLSAFMATINLFPLRSDYAVFTNQNRTLFVAVYVDDILIFGKNSHQIQDLKSQLHKRFQMTDMGQAHLYLGMQIIRDRASRTIKVDQQKYIQIILERFNMGNCNSVSTPMETGLKLCKRSDKASPQEIHQYQKLMGCLEYAAIATRPDITFSVHRLAQFASNPDNNHLNAAKRILRYLKGSMEYGLVFRGSEVEKFELIGYSDADWAGSTIDRKSIGGYCFYLNNCLVSHMSKKQKTVALSTAESETHAAVQATKEAIWLRALLEELGFKQNHPTTIRCDNQAAIALSRNPEFHSRSKHVDIQYHFLRQHVDIGTVELKFIPSDKMAADGLTKPLSRQKHNSFCEFMQSKNIMGNIAN